MFIQQLLGQHQLSFGLLGLRVMIRLLIGDTWSLVAVKWYQEYKLVDGALQKGHGSRSSTTCRELVISNRKVHLTN